MPWPVPVTHTLTSIYTHTSWVVLATYWEVLVTYSLDDTFQLRPGKLVKHAPGGTSHARSSKVLLSYTRGDAGRVSPRWYFQLCPGKHWSHTHRKALVAHALGDITHLQPGSNWEVLVAYAVETLRDHVTYVYARRLEWVWWSGQKHHRTARKGLSLSLCPSVLHSLSLSLFHQDRGLIHDPVVASG